MISENVTNWLGYPVKLFNPDEKITDYRNTIYRLAVDWDSDLTVVDLFEKFLADPASAETPAIIFGLFGEHDDTSEPIVQALVDARDRLPKLKGIFLGDIISEENEISWINQSDVSPIFQAFPALEHFRVRGNEGLSLGQIEHESLKSLIIETGGLSLEVIQDVLDSDLPALEHLELWLGDDGYGWDGSIEDLEPLLDGGLFPNLKSLGLRDSVIQDDIAVAVSKASIVRQLEVLDLSLGTLTDVGGQALLDSPELKSLRKLDLHHHFLSTDMVNRLRNSGLNVNLDDQQKVEVYNGEEYRYVAVSE